MRFFLGAIGKYRSILPLFFAFSSWFPAVTYAQTTPGLNLYDKYTTSYTIPYTSPPDYDDPAAALHVSVSVDGSAPLTYQVDTGSQGVVVPQYLIPGFVQAPLADQQKILYSSSGNYSLGTWATETISFPGSHDAEGQEATATVQVLVESESVTDNGQITTDCSIQGARCTTLLGIGYGRPDAGWGPDYLPSLDNNPLLNITGMADGSVRAGYVITPTGIEAGLTAANAGSGYAYTQLVPNTPAGENSPNWTTLPGSVVVNGSTVQSGGGVLLDTGISYAWANLGSTIAANSVPCGDSFSCAPPGTVVTVYLGANDSVGFSYTVGASDNSTAAPEFLRVNGGAAMNAGIHPFSIFDYVLMPSAASSVSKRSIPEQRGLILLPVLPSPARSLCRMHSPLTFRSM